MKNGGYFNLRAYTAAEFNDKDNKDCIFVHKDVKHAFSDEIVENITLINNANICKYLQLRTNETIETKSNILNSVKSALKDCPVMPNIKYVVPHFGKSVTFEVVSVDNISNKISLDFSNLSIKTSTPKRTINDAEEYKIITEITEFEILENLALESKIVTPRSMSIGGVNNELKIIRKAIDSLNFKTKSYIGILLYGPSGTGKTLLANVVINELSDFHRININGAEIFSQYAGETEARLKHLFNQTLNFEKSVIFIDEFDVLTNTNSEQERRVNATIKVLVDSLSELQNHLILLIATSSRPDAIEASFRRPSRLDLEIELPIPNLIQRKEIISIFKDKFNANLSENDIDIISQNAHGYVGADLEALIAQATLNGQNDKKSCLEALKIVKPSAMREVQVTVPNVIWEDIGGLDDLKLQLRQAIEWPIKHPEIFHKMGINPPKGVLMYGPPGCSKTMIAKALANESQLNFVAIKGPELFKKYVGESEQVSWSKILFLHVFLKI